MPYPHFKSFASTIIDDTDNATVENIRPVYDYFASQNDWFVPASILLNHLLEQKKPESVSPLYTNALDLKWLTNRIFKKIQHGR